MNAIDQVRRESGLDALPLSGIEGSRAREIIGGLHEQRRREENAANESLANRRPPLNSTSRVLDE